MCITIVPSGFGCKQLSEHENEIIARSGIFISHKIMGSQSGNTVATGTHELWSATVTLSNQELQNIHLCVADMPQFRIISVLLTRIGHLNLFGLLDNFRCHNWQTVEKSAFFSQVTCGQTFISTAHDKLGHIKSLDCGIKIHLSVCCILFPTVINHAVQYAETSKIQIHFFLGIKLFTPGRFLKVFLNLVLD